MSLLSKKTTLELLVHLDKTFGEIKPFLNHNNAFELLIAVILSAQTTDNMVNKVTPELFERFPDAKSLKNAPLEEVELLIRKINYYRTKAKNIIKTSKMIDVVYGGVIPQTIDELVNLLHTEAKVI